MATQAIKKETLDFLKTLSKHNDRDWFNAHKDKYTKAHENMIAFADGLIGEMNKHDKLETTDGKKSLFRILQGHTVFKGIKLLIVAGLAEASKEQLKN